MATVLSWNIRTPHIVLTAVILILIVFTLTSIGPLSSTPFHGSVPNSRPPEHTNPTPPVSNLPPTEKVSPPASKWEFQVERDGDGYGLTDEQCSSAFPKLYVEIDKAVARRKDKHITKEELDSRKWLNGMVRGMVYNGEVLSSSKDFG
jgi:hypothetical protein